MPKRKDEPIKRRPSPAHPVCPLYVDGSCSPGSSYLVYTMFVTPEAREILKDYGPDAILALRLSMAATTGGVVVIIRMLVAQIKDFPPGVLDQVMNQPDLKTYE